MTEFTNQSPAEILKEAKGKEIPILYALDAAFPLEKGPIIEQEKLKQMKLMIVDNTGLILEDEFEDLDTGQTVKMPFPAETSRALRRLGLSFAVKDKKLVVADKDKNLYDVDVRNAYGESEEECNIPMGDELEQLEQYSAVIFTGSPQEVKIAKALQSYDLGKTPQPEFTPHHQRLMEMMHYMIENDVLGYGICFGSQALVASFWQHGGRLKKNLGPRVLGSSLIKKTKQGKSNPILEGVPKDFAFLQSHRTDYNLETLPRNIPDEIEFVPLATGEQDNVEFIAVYHQNKLVFVGSQGHPEFVSVAATVNVNRWSQVEERFARLVEKGILLGRKEITSENLQAAQKHIKQAWERKRNLERAIKHPIHEYSGKIMQNFLELVWEQTREKRKKTKLALA